MISRSDHELQRLTNGLCRLCFGGILLWLALPLCGAANVSPTITQTLPDRVLGRAAAPASIDLNGYFNDPDVAGTAVRLSVRIASTVKTIDLALTDTATPLTVANFKAYVNSGRFTDNFFHRSVPGFVIQSGGFRFVGPNTYDVVPTYAPVLNEPGLSNVRGTIAMAKVGGDPNSATSGWFINLADNSANLDSQNGGFTVFGRVVGSGMTVVDEISAIPRYNATSAHPDWSTLPLTAGVLTRANFIESSASEISALSYGVTVANSVLVTAVITNGSLQLTPATDQSGTTTVTVTATDLDGASHPSTFTVTVLDTLAAWSGAYTFAQPVDSGAEADPDADGLANLLEFAFGGEPLQALSVAGAPRPEQTGGVTFYHRTQAALDYEVFTSTDLQTWSRLWQTADGFTHAAISAQQNLTLFTELTVKVPGESGVPRRFWRVKVTPRSL